MNTRSQILRLFTIGLVAVLFTACDFPSAVQPTQTPGALTGGNGSLGNGPGSGNGGNGGVPNNPPPGVSTPVSTLQPTDQLTPTPTLPTIGGSPYMVKQTESLGGETLQSPGGGICINLPWQVPASTSKVSWVMLFGPQLRPDLGGNKSTFGYAYSIPSAGESHAAQGSYTMNIHQDGTITVSITGSDHVVFKGFDGNIPVRYQFDLVPIGGNAKCPGQN